MNITDYRVYIKANLLVIIGYALVTAETLIAAVLGLTGISCLHVLAISLSVISGSLCCIIILYFRRSYGPDFVKNMFFILAVLYFVMFSVWVYLLGDFRLFGLFSSILAVTTILLYASFCQAMILSAGTIVAYAASSWYSIFMTGRPGNFITDIFFALCMIPTSILFSYVANQIKKKNNELERIKEVLEDSNEELVEVNRRLEKSQKTTNVEIDLACDIQKALFPEAPRNIDAWDIALHFKPRQGLSGDFYDFYYDGGHLTGLSLFDVSGHGLPSALITILAKPVIYRYFNLFRNEPLGRVAEVSNNTLRHELSELDMYITGAVIRFKGDDLEYVNMGHPDMLYKRAATGKAEMVIEKDAYYKSSPIGMLDTISSRRSLKLSPAPGDILLLYTDCITESNDINKNRYGNSRLLHSLEEAPDGTAEEILKYLLGRFDLFMNAKETDDDFTAILIKKK